MQEGDAPTIFGDGEQSRDFTYVENVVQANMAAALRPASEVSGECFNIGTGRRISLNHLFEVLQEILDFTGRPRYQPMREGDVRHSLADISHARAV